MTADKYTSPKIQWQLLGRLRRLVVVGHRSFRNCCWYGCQTLSWTPIQTAFDPDPAIHWQRGGALGLVCPDNRFKQLFHEHHDTKEFGDLLRWVDWSLVHWEAVEAMSLAKIVTVALAGHMLIACSARTAENREKWFTSNRKMTSSGIRYL